jgi:hypothetical protein
MRVERTQTDIVLVFPEGTWVADPRQSTLPDLVYHKICRTSTGYHRHRDAHLLADPTGRLLGVLIRIPSLSAPHEITEEYHGQTHCVMDCENRPAKPQRARWEKYPDVYTAVKRGSQMRKYYKRDFSEIVLIAYGALVAETIVNKPGNRYLRVSIPFEFLLACSPVAGGFFSPSLSFFFLVSLVIRRIY